MACFGSDRSSGGPALSPPDPPLSGGLALSPPDPPLSGGLALSPPDPPLSGGLALSPPDPPTTTGVKSASESLTSGGSTVMPIRRQVPRYLGRASLSSLTLVSSAAMYSTGWWALRYAVCQVTRP